MPNGELTSAQLRFFGDTLNQLGEGACADITTRANIQLRGITLADADKIMEVFGWSVELLSSMAGSVQQDLCVTLDSSMCSWNMHHHVHAFHVSREAEKQLEEKQLKGKQSNCCTSGLAHSKSANISACHSQCWSFHMPNESLRGQATHKHQVISWRGQCLSLTTVHAAQRVHG